MCLIMYSPEGQLPPQQVWQDASKDNPDGVGVMSERGIVKWVGRKGYNKAWRHINRLSKAGVPYAVHFRWRTHGATSRDMCHPHQTELGSYVMHNGVLGPTSNAATSDKSDTALYVDWFLHGISDWQPVQPLIEAHIGIGNKFVIMDERKQFHIFNEYVGVYHRGIWYSNDYSFAIEFYNELDAENNRHTSNSRSYLLQPRASDSSAAWEEYYKDLYASGEIDEDELDDFLDPARWECDDLSERDDYDDYSDRMIRDSYTRRVL